jgi:cell division protein FtsZ
MTLNLTIPKQTHTDFNPRITVIGVGGGGTNAVDNMIAMNLQGVEFVVANTDAQQLIHSRADRRIQLGPHITQGLGAGAKPDVGRAAAEEAADELARQLEGTHMLFITAGMGGGTGTGAAPVIARMARERNILTVGVVTKPFTFEGSRRARAADDGIAELQQFVDTLIVIPNQNLFRLANERTGWREAFKMADNVLYMGVRGVTDLMVAPGLVNLDFADIRTIMLEMGKAMMGTGEAEGEGRAIRAAEAAISNPLLEDTCMAGAKGLLINITGGEDMTLFEVDEAANRIRREVDDEANIIFGSAIDETLEGRVRVSVVATGIESAVRLTERPKLVAVGGGAVEEAVSATATATITMTPPPGAPTTGFAPHVGGGAQTIPLRPSQSGSVTGIRPGVRPAAVPPQPPMPTNAPPAGAAPAPAATTEAERVEAGQAAAPQVEAIRRETLRADQSRAEASRETANSASSILFSQHARETQPVPPPRMPIFNAVTGLFRRGAHVAQGAAATAAERSRPVAADPAPVVVPDPVHTADRVDIDIPTFLRQQRSHPTTH